MDTYKEQLQTLEASGNLRKLPGICHEGRYVVSEDGKKMLNLSSNDYLALSSGHDGLMSGFLMSLPSMLNENALSEDILLSSSSSRLLTGNFGIYGRVEDLLCRLYGRQAALVLGSGYHMNIGILPAVADSGTMILADKLVHASIIDGIRLSTARSVRYRHQDLDQLENLLSRYSNEYGRIIIVTESIFSMDGDVSDLRRLADMKKRFPGVMLYVDEAHAAGVRGDTGLGVAQEQGVIGDIDFLCATFGKALASAGAYVVCDADVRDYLVNRMRSLIFTTALPPLNMLWTLHVLENLAGMTERRRRLHSNSERLRSALISSGLPCPSGSHIIPVLAGDSHRAVEMAAAMQRAGFYLLPVRPPTVPEGTSRLRISLTADVTDAEVSDLIAHISGLQDGGGNLFMRNADSGI